MEIWVVRDDEPYGPYSLDEIREYLADGFIVADDQAWRVGLEDWCRLREIPEVGLPAEEPVPQPPPLPSRGAPPEPEVIPSPPPLPRSRTESPSDPPPDPTPEVPPEPPPALPLEARPPILPTPVGGGNGDGAWTYCRAVDEPAASGWTGEALAAHLATADSVGWVWTPGMASWAPAAMFPTLHDRFDGRLSPPRLPPLRGRTEPLGELWAMVREAVADRGRLRQLGFLSILQFVPILSSILNRGWRLDILASRPGDPYPGRAGLGRYFVHGSLVWAMYFLYLLPEILFGLVQGYAWIGDYLGILSYVAGMIASGNPAKGLGAFLADVGVGFVVKSGFLIFYPIVTWPFYRVAMMRYAVERKLRVFFQIRRNYRVVRRSYPLMLHVFVQDKLLWLSLAVVGFLVSLTGVGVLVMVGFFRPLRVLITGLLYRNLLGRLRDAELWHFGDEAAPAHAEAVDTEPATGRSWFVADPERGDVTPDRLEVGQVGALMAASHAAGDPRMFWTPGMWRWEGAERARDVLGWASPPPLRTVAAPTRTLADALRVLPSRIVQTLHPVAIWRDLRASVAMLGQSATGDANADGEGRRASWLRRWRHLVWFVALHFVPAIGSVINRGWRIDFMRSASAGAAPESSNAGRHFATGMLLWGVYLLYILPLFVILAMTDFRWIEQVLRIGWWILQSTFGATPSDTLGAILFDGVVTFLVETVAYGSYSVVAWALYRSAMIRFALEDDLRVFSELAANWRMSRTNFETLTAVYLGQKTLWGLYLALTAMLVATGIGAVLVPAVAAPARLLISGLIYLRGMQAAPSLSGCFERDEGEIEAAIGRRRHHW